MPEPTTEEKAIYMSQESLRRHAYFTQEDMDDLVTAERERIARFLPDWLMKRGVWDFDYADLVRRIRDGDMPR